MDFQITDGRIFNEDENGQTLAEITYFKSKVDGDVVVADHTYVDPSLRGQGVAEQLVDALVDEMEKEGKKIEPLCPYIVTLFKRKADKYKEIAHK